MQNAKILCLDIETTPAEGWFWGKIWETNIIKTIKQSMILSYSAKWLEGKHITRGWIDFNWKKPVESEKKLLQEIWDLFDEADIVTFQNGKAFDVKKINARFLYHGFNPPSPYKVVDTKIEAKKYLDLPSYALDYMCTYFNIGKKLEHEGLGLWEKCIAGDLKAWARMLKYNKHDVTLTEQLYLKLRPFIKTHPNIGNIINNQCCPSCGSKDLIWRGYYNNSTTKYRRAVCKTCGTWSKSPINLQKIKLLTPI